jgi:hypothetical protein
MNAKEVRIGNLVSNQDGTLTGIPVGIPHKLELEDFKFIEFYVPIPITEKLLASLGLGPRALLWFLNDNYWCYSEHESSKLKFYTLNGTDWIVRINHQDLCEIKYVHQLQNIYFAIYNEELELKNSAI